MRPVFVGKHIGTFSQTERQTRTFVSFCEEAQTASKKPTRRGTIRKVFSECWNLEDFVDVLVLRFYMTAQIALQAEAKPLSYQVMINAL